MSNFLNSFVPEKVTAQTMPIGSHDVIVKQAVEVTDHDANLSGAQKENYRFSDFHDQIAVTFIRKDKQPGIITHRYNTKGWVRYDELSPADRKSFKRDEEKGYAINKKTGMRVEDDKRTADCNNILNQFLNKLSKNGKPIIDDLIAVGHLDLDMLTGAECNITVSEEKYGEKTRAKVTAVRKVSAVPVLNGVVQEEY